MSTYLTRMRANAFGMPMLDDYGMDAYPERFEPDPTDDHMQRQVMALLDMDEPARQVRTPVQNDALEAVADVLVGALRDAGAIAPVAVLADLDMNAPAKRRRTEREIVPAREPDFYDEGMAWWISDLGAVGFEVEHHEVAAERLDNHGWKVRQGILPSECGFVVMPHSDEPWSAGMGRCNLAYALWTIALDAVAVTA